MIDPELKILLPLTAFTVLLGCAIHMEPVVTKRPALPTAWGSMESTKLVGSCPEISGTYEITPLIIELEKNGQWGDEFTGDEWDHVWLVYSPDSIEVKRDQPGNRKFMTIDQSGASSWSLIVTSKTDSFIEISSTFLTESGQFECVGGEMKLPEYRHKAGAEGVNFNDLILRSIFATTGGDLIVYEQKHEGRRSVRHRYYRFSRV